ncbi:DUF4148 domain-containing protein [Bordetella bronchialis]|uniref:DUF4148 domain-containing protein n=1 Tax=Bordetella bronchialis TaxID=463025 RepID=A0A193FQF9_9BORD|nr:DUF4148 domain-containing protein [Bordetella bronchialis]ANN64958.1 hypothetical protein BAU06_00290 [Bordetella bronchialis]ANN69987.1 hypothetical protein BAU08_00280 [Bordetella bronchialis]
MYTKTVISSLILSFAGLGAVRAEAAPDVGLGRPPVHTYASDGRTSSEDLNNIPFGGMPGQAESGLTREQVLAELRDAPRPGPFDELPLGQGDSGSGDAGF